MHDLSPITLFAIGRESLGGWFWPLLVLAALLLAGLILGALRRRRAGAPVGRPLLTAMLVALVSAVVFAVLAPWWTQADTGALNGAIDYVAAYLLGLIPGAALGCLVFIVGSLRTPPGRVGPGTAGTHR